MKRTLFVAVVVVALMLSAVVYAWAAADTKTVTVNATLGNAFEMTIANAAVTFGTIADPALPTAGSVSPAISVKSNKLWKFEYTAPVNFTESGGSLTPMPINKMTWSSVPALTGSGGAMVGGAAQTLGTNLARGSAAANTFTFSYSLTPGLDYDPGDYNASINYTATQN